MSSSALPVEITDSHRNTVTTICRSSVFQSISELATSFSLSSIELLGDECVGILNFMYVCNGWFFLCVREGFLSALVQSFPTICLFLLLIYNIHVVVLPVHQLLELMFT